MLAALTAIGGNDLKNRYAAAKKGDLAEAAEKLCAGTSIVEAEVRAAAVAWVPDAMTCGTASEPASEADKNGRDDVDDDEPLDASDDDTFAASREDAFDDAA